MSLDYAMQDAMPDSGWVSIIMPNYNGEKYLPESIGSVIAQSYTNWELLVVDDCSTDRSVDLIEKYVAGNPKIFLFRNERNVGAAGSRNRALEQAKGRWIAFLDADDVWLPQKLERQLRFMQDRGCSLSFTDYLVIDEFSEEKALFVPSKEEYTYQNILRKNDIGCLTVIYDADAIGKYPMPEKAVKREDYACWLAILKGCNGYCLHDPLAKYRVHSSVSSNKIKMAKYQWNVYRLEKVCFPKAVWYMCCWAFFGLHKYKRKSPAASKGETA